jgi:hypothetical protein
MRWRLTRDPNYLWKPFQLSPNIPCLRQITYKPIRTSLAFEHGMLKLKYRLQYTAVHSTEL